MVKKILDAAGINCAEGLFRQPPRTTYAVYLDAVEVRGADCINLIEEHSVTVELYMYKKDIESEKKLEKAFDDFAVAYTKQDCYWLQDEQLYQVIYEFNYIDKK